MSEEGCEYKDFGGVSEITHGKKIIKLGENRIEKLLEMSLILKDYCKYNAIPIFNHRNTTSIIIDRL